MTSFLTLYTAVTDSLGRDDTLAVSVAKRGVNYGYLLSALLFEPVELKTYGNVTVTANAAYVSLSTLTRLRYIHRIDNATSLSTVHPMDIEKFSIIVPSGLTYVEYYCREGSILFVNPPVSANVLTIMYTMYPLELTADADEILFSYHDAAIISNACSYAFASLEEKESSSMWDTALSTYATAYSLNAKKLQEFKEAMKSSGYAI